MRKDKKVQNKIKFNLFYEEYFTNSIIENDVESKYRYYIDNVLILDYQIIRKNDWHRFFPCKISINYEKLTLLNAQIASKCSTETTHDIKNLS